MCKNMLHCKIVNIIFKFNTSNQTNQKRTDKIFFNYVKFKLILFNKMLKLIAKITVVVQLMKMNPSNSQKTR